MLTWAAAGAHVPRSTQATTTAERIFRTPVPKPDRRAGLSATVAPTHCYLKTMDCSDRLPDHLGNARCATVHSPPDPVVLPVIARAAPQGAMLAIDENRVDRA